MKDSYFTSLYETSKGAFDETQRWINCTSHLDINNILIRKIRGQYQGVVNSDDVMEY